MLGFFFFRECLNPYPNPEVNFALAKTSDLELDLASNPQTGLAYPNQ
jgi:hypothetical protein